MSGANFASLHGGMLQRSDLPAEKAAHPKKVSVPDGVYGATGVAHHLSDEIVSKKVIGVDRRDALPSKADGPNKPKKFPAKETEASTGLAGTQVERANEPVALSPVFKSRGPLQMPASGSKSSRLVQALRGEPAAHQGPLSGTENENRPSEDDRNKPALPFKRGFGRLQTGDTVSSERNQPAETRKMDNFFASTANQDTPRATTPATEEKPKRKALTVRLLPGEYRRLKGAGAFLDRTSQDILVSAMDEYLKQLGFTHEK